MKRWEITITNNYEDEVFHVDGYTIGDASDAASYQMNLDGYNHTWWIYKIEVL